MKKLIFIVGILVLSATAKASPCGDFDPDVLKKAKRQIQRSTGVYYPKPSVGFALCDSGWTSVVLDLPRRAHTSVSCGVSLGFYGPQASEDLVSFAKAARVLGSYVVVEKSGELVSVPVCARNIGSVQPRD